MAIAGSLGARMYVSATPLTNVDAAADSYAEFNALTVNSEVGLIENFGELGRVFELVTFISVAEGRTRKFKGPYNDGRMDLVVGADLGDTGQAIVEASATGINQDTLPVKITLVGAAEAFDTIFFGGKFMSYRLQIGNASSVVRALIGLEINTEVFVGAGGT